MAEMFEVAPYFDILLQRLREGEPRATRAFGRHVHWGYWPQPDHFAGTPEDYGDAAERLCQKMLDAAGVRDGLRVLDVGCGLGGTIASLNERCTGLDLVGVNIDPRQIAWAEEHVRPRAGNKIRFLVGDACALPFTEPEFDVVLAVECIFHFPSRLDFFRGAVRALKPGGLLVLSDMVPAADMVSYLQRGDPTKDEAARRAYGKIDLTCSIEGYRALAEQVGLTLTHVEDISREVLPTYRYLLDDLGNWSDQELAASFRRSTRQLETAQRIGLILYTILTFAR